MQLIEIADKPVVTTDLGMVAPIVATTTRPLQTAQSEGRLGVYSESFAVMTESQAPKFYDVTDLVATVVERSGIAAGTFTASTRHTTCAMVVQENEPLLLQDMADRLCRFANADETFRHNDFDIRTVNMCDGECANGHSHCQHLVLGASVTLPIQDGRPVLGLWQRIFLIELDRARPRHFSVQVMGVYANLGQPLIW
jgi:secondary thiamine-phosphate synthase enzyme